MRKFMVLILLVAILFIYGCTRKVESTTTTTISDDDSNVAFNGIAKSECINSGGNFNTCGSPCAGTGQDFCIQVCRTQCECGGIAGFNCPEGYECMLSGKIADEMGVCVK